MRAMLEKILRCYGKELEIRGENGVHRVRAFVQPVTGQGGDLSKISNSPLGSEEKGQYRYIGPASPAVAAGDRLACREGTFLFRHCETVEGIGGPAYCWGICVREGEEDTWGLNG